MLAKFSIGSLHRGLGRWAVTISLGLAALVASPIFRPALAAPFWYLEAARGDNQVAFSQDGSLKLRRFSARRVPDGQERFNLVWAVIPADLYRVRVQVVNSQSILSGLARCSGDVAMTGGFSDGAKSKGWVVSGKAKVSELATDFDGGGAFVATSSGLQIIRKADISHYANVDEALQSTPILIFDGKFDGASEDVDSWNRAGIGLTTDGNIIIALVYGPKSSLADFGRLLVDLAETGHAPKIRAAIGLDSRVTGTIRLRISGQHFGAEREEFTPNIFCFERKVAP
jgi:hypothetical protein